MSALLDASKLMRSGDFRRRVEAAIAKAIIDVQAESDQTPEHAARLAWAKAQKTFAQLERQAELFLWRIIATGTILADYRTAGNDQSVVTDQQITNAVNGLINTYAADYAPE